MSYGGYHNRAYAAADLGQNTHQQLTGNSANGDALSAARRFLGPPTSFQNMGSYGHDVPTTHDDVAKIYEGQNLFLRDTIIGFTLESREFYSFVLPWLETDQMNITFNIFDFGNGIATRVPSEGIPRVLAASSSTFSDSVERFGVAMIMEGDFLRTEAGQNRYRMNIASISQACLRATNLATMVKLLTCKDYAKAYTEIRQASSKTLEVIEDIEASQFACLAVDRESFDGVVSQQRSYMAHHGGTADTLIVFPGFPWFHNMVQQGTATEYWQTGPDGQQYLQQGPTSNFTFRGIPVFESEPFAIGGPKSGPMQPLSRAKTVGECYPVVMGDHRTKSIGGRYNSNWRAIFVYSLESDSYVKISLMEMFMNSNMFGGRDDNDRLSGATKILVDKANAEFDRDGGFDYEHAVYSNPHELERNVGNMRSERLRYMHLSHNVIKKRVQEVMKFSEFDVDVVTTADFIQVAETAIYSMFGTSAPDIERAVNRAASFVELLEDQTYNDAFAAALVRENINKSVTTEGRFVGFRQADGDPIDWSGNAYSGLDLPKRDAASGWSSYGVGLANFPMIQTLAMQGLERGYDAAVVAQAKSVVDLIKMISLALSRNLPQSGATKAENVQPHFNYPTNEMAIYNYLFVARPPVFLGIGQGKAKGKVDNRSGPMRPIAQEDSPLVWVEGRPFDPKTLVFGDSVPISKKLTLLSSLVKDDVPKKGTLERIGIPPAGLKAAAIDDYVRQLAANFPKDFDSRANMLLSAIDKIFRAHNGDPKYAYIAQEKGKDFLATLTEAAKSLQAENAKGKRSKLFQKLLDSAEESALNVLQGAEERYKEDFKTPADQAKNTEFGEWFIEVQNNAGIPVFKVRGASDMFAELAAKKIAGELRDKSKSETGQMSGLDVLRTVTSNLELAGLATEPFTGIKFKIADYDAWVEDVYNSEKDEKIDMDNIASLYGKYIKVEQLIQQTARDAFNDFAESGMGMELSKEGNLRAGDEFPVEQQKESTDVGPATVYFRSPLAMSPTLLRSIAALPGKPFMVPADPRTNFTTEFIAWEGVDRPSISDFVTVLADASMNDMTSGRVRPNEYSDQVAASPLQAQSHYRALFGTPAVNPSDWGQDQYLFDVSDARAGGGDVEISIRQRQDGTFEIDPDRLEEDMRRENIARAKAGLPAVSASKGIYRAHERAKHLEREEMAQREVRVALGSIPSASRMYGSSSRLSVDPIDRAAANDRSFIERKHRGGRQTDIHKRAREFRDPYSQKRSRHDNDYLRAEQYHGYDRNGRGRRDERNPYPSLNSNHRDHYGHPEDSRGHTRYEEEEDQFHIHPNSIYRHERLDDILNPLVRLVVQAIYELPNTYSAWHSMIEKDIHIPMNFIVWRLHIELEMYTCILMQSGIDTGANVIGTSNMVFSHTSGDKMMNGHFTYHHASMVFKPENVRHLNDVFPNGYVAGWGVSFVQDPDEIRRRDRNSIIVTGIPITENRRELRYDFTDTTVERTLPATSTRSAGKKVLASFSSASYYELIWHFEEQVLAHSRTELRYHTEKDRINTRASVGKYFSYMENGRRFTRKNDGCGPLSGNRTCVGARSVWIGTAKSMFPMDTEDGTGFE